MTGRPLPGSRTSFQRSAIKIAPVSGALGAEVAGVDLRSLSDDDVAQVRSAVHEYEVVFLRGVDLTEQEQLTVGGRFGRVNLFPLARLRGATEPTPMVITDGPDGPSADHWHTDVTWTAEPPDYALLQALVVPERGGDTLWASMTAAYDALSPVMQELLVELEVVHDNESFIAGLLAGGVEQPGIDKMADALRAQYPPVVHPLVRVHPDTGRRLLFLGGGFMRRIQGMTDTESQALLRLLAHHIDDPRFHCRWRWQAGDLAIWDERSTNHRSAGDHFPQPRSIRRIEVGGARPRGVR
ncbi:MAG: TauD/TfdA family dioxygenase [Acidimicrobiales bacterium]